MKYPVNNVNNMYSFDHPSIHALRHVQMVALFLVFYFLCYFFTQALVCDSCLLLVMRPLGLLLPLFILIPYTFMIVEEDRRLGILEQTIIQTNHILPYVLNKICDLYKTILPIVTILFIQTYTGNGWRVSCVFFLLMLLFYGSIVMTTLIAGIGQAHEQSFFLIFIPVIIPAFMGMTFLFEQDTFLMGMGLSVANLMCIIGCTLLIMPYFRMLY